ncbi:DUF4097 domain-containing protein [Candidatus Zixiibacteriota bacterium]
MAVLAIGVLSFSLCAALSTAEGIRGAGQDNPAQQRYTSVSEQTLPLPVDGIFRLTNYHGDITVAGTNGRMVLIRAIREVEAQERSVAQALLTALSFTVAGGDTAVEVVTRLPEAAVVREITGSDPESTRLRISYVVEVPADVRISVRSTSGSIVIHDVDRTVDLDTMSGNMTVRNAGGPVVAGSASGDIDLTDIGRRIRATCVSGDITIRGDVPADVEANNTGGSIRWNGRVGEGGLIRLSSHSGDIEFTALGETGFSVNLSTISGSISTPLALVLTGETTSRRSLQGEYLEPVARVELTAFSGNITLITRP